MVDLDLLFELSRLLLARYDISKRKINITENSANTICADYPGDYDSSQHAKLALDQSRQHLSGRIVNDD